MKYSEFKAEVEKLDWCVTGNKYEVHVLNHGGGKLMVIYKTDTHVLDPNHISYVTLTHEDKSVLLDLSVKLAKTPLAEREEEKKYNVILPNILRDRKPILLCKSFDDHESCGIDWSPKDWLDDNMDRHIFTEQEIKDIDERYLAFKVEVKDE